MTTYARTYLRTVERVRATKKIIDNFLRWPVDCFPARLIRILKKLKCLDSCCPEQLNRSVIRPDHTLFNAFVPVAASIKPHFTESIGYSAMSK